VRPTVLLLGLDMIHGFELHTHDALHLYPATPRAHPATVNASSPAALEAVSSPGPIQRSEGLLHGIPLGLAFEQTLRMSLDLDWDVGCALLWCKVVVMGGRGARTHSRRRLVRRGWWRSCLKYVKRLGRSGECSRSSRCLIPITSCMFPCRVLPCKATHSPENV